MVLDLEKLKITWPYIDPIQDDATHPGSRDNSVDLVSCAEALSEFNIESDFYRYVSSKF